MRQIIKDNYIDKECIINYSDNKIIIIPDKNKEPWFMGARIAKMLGYLDSRKAIVSNISKNNKKKFNELQEYVIKKPKNSQPHSIFINKKGIIQLLASSEKTNLDKICKDFGIKTKYRYKRKEIEIVDELKIFFEQFNVEIVTQKYVKKYKVDVYIPEYDLVIEIDENNHKDRDEKYEKQRENNIKKWKKCKFIRCNPDDAIFNMNQLTGKITKHIIEHMQQNN